MTPPSLRPLSVGEILDVSFTLYRRHFRPLATVALICSGIPVALNLFLEAAGGLLANGLLAVAYYVAFVVLNSIATAATVFIVSESYLGRPLGAREALTRALPYLGRIILCSLLMGLVVFLGFLLLIVPGLVLIAGLLLAVPVLVLEPGMSPSAALSRSWELTRGSKWRMLGLLVTVFALLYIPLAAVGGLFAVMGIFLFGLVLAGLIQVFVYPLFYCVLTIAYYDLRVRREGFDLEVLAATLRSP